MIRQPIPDIQGGPKLPLTFGHPVFNISNQESLQLSIIYISEYKRIICTEWMELMSHSKWRETKQQPSMLPGPDVLGCCLVSFSFLCDIYSSHSVQCSSDLMTTTMCRVAGLVDIGQLKKFIFPGNEMLLAQCLDIPCIFILPQLSTPSMSPNGHLFAPCVISNTWTARERRAASNSNRSLSLFLRPFL